MFVIIPPQSRDLCAFRRLHRRGVPSRGCSTVPPSRISPDVACQIVARLTHLGKGPLCFRKQPLITCTAGVPGDSNVSRVLRGPPHVRGRPSQSGIPARTSGPSHGSPQGLVRAVDLLLSAALKISYRFGPFVIQWGFKYTALREVGCKRGASGSLLPFTRTPRSSRQCRTRWEHSDGSKGLIAAIRKMCAVAPNFSL
jgi:hypothetical protein